MTLPIFIGIFAVVALAVCGWIIISGLSKI